VFGGWLKTVVKVGSGEQRKRVNPVERASESKAPEMEKRGSKGKTVYWVGLRERQLQYECLGEKKKNNIKCRPSRKGNGGRKERPEGGGEFRSLRSYSKLGYKTLGGGEKRVQKRGGGWQGVKKAGGEREVSFIKGGQVGKKRKKGGGGRCGSEDNMFGGGRKKLNKINVTPKEGNKPRGMRKKTKSQCPLVMETTRAKKKPRNHCGNSGGTRGGGWGK